MFVSWLRWQVALARQRFVLAKGETHEIVVPPGPSGRPGERVLAPTTSFYSPRLTPDGAREDFRVLLDRAGTTLASVCLGPVAERGDAEDSALRTLGRFNVAVASVRDRLTGDTVAGLPALRYQINFRSGVLTEWKFSHRGWLFVAGVLERGGDVDGGIAAAREVLSTWEWVTEDAGGAS
jgi:hypothetical protein